jgi:hypothetical protein
MSNPLKPQLKLFSIRTLRGIITDYNLHIMIRGSKGKPLSKMTKDELIDKIDTHLHYQEGIDNKIYFHPKIMNTEFNVYQRPPRVRKPKAEPQFIDVAPSKGTTPQELMRFMEETEKLYPTKSKMEFITDAEKIAVLKQIKRFEKALKQKKTKNK